MTQQQNASIKSAVDFQQHLASQFEAFQAVASDTASAAKKLMELNISAARQAFEHSKTGVPHLFSATSPEEFAARAKNFSEPVAESTQTYAKAAVEILKEASARISTTADKQFSDGAAAADAATKTFVAGVSEHFPVAGAHVAETMKKAMSTAQEGMTTLSKQSKVFAVAAEEKITKTMRSAKK